MEIPLLLQYLENIALQFQIKFQKFKYARIKYF